MSDHRHHSPPPVPAAPAAPSNVYKIAFSTLYTNQGDNTTAPRYIKTLGRGNQGATQLTFAPEIGETGQICVRKVHRPPTEDKYENFNETRVARKLLEIQSLREVQFAELYEDNVTRVEDDDGEERWVRETYWRYYNAGTAASIFWGRDKDFVKPPLYFIARYMTTLCQTVQIFRMNNTGRVIYHQDLHMNNVLLNWESFANNSYWPEPYICDFGHAVMSKKPVVALESNDLERLAEQFEILIKLSEVHPDDPAMKKLYASYEYLADLVEKSRTRIIKEYEWDELINPLRDQAHGFFDQSQADIDAASHGMSLFREKIKAANTEEDMKPLEIIADSPAEARQIADGLDIHGPWVLVQGNRAEDSVVVGQESLGSDMDVRGGLDLLYIKPSDRRFPKQFRAAHNRLRRGRQLWLWRGGKGKNYTHADYADGDFFEDYEEEEAGSQVAESYIEVTDSDEGLPLEERIKRRGPSFAFPYGWLEGGFEDDPMVMADEETRQKIREWKAAHKEWYEEYLRTGIWVPTESEAGAYYAKEKRQEARKAEKRKALAKERAQAAAEAAKPKKAIGGVKIKEESISPTAERPRTLPQGHLTNGTRAPSKHGKKTVGLGDFVAEDEGTQKRKKTPSLPSSNKEGEKQVWDLGNGFYLPKPPSLEEQARQKDEGEFTRLLLDAVLDGTESQKMTRSRIKALVKSKPQSSGAETRGTQTSPRGTQSMGTQTSPTFERRAAASSKKRKAAAVVDLSSEEEEEEEPPVKKAKKTPPKTKKTKAPVIDLVSDEEEDKPPVSVKKTKKVAAKPAPKPAPPARPTPKSIKRKAPVDDHVSDLASEDEQPPAKKPKKAPIPKSAAKPKTPKKPAAKPKTLKKKAPISDDEDLISVYEISEPEASAVKKKKVAVPKATTRSAKRKAPVDEDESSEEEQPPVKKAKKTPAKTKAVTKTPAKSTAKKPAVKTPAAKKPAVEEDDSSWTGRLRTRTVRVVRVGKGKGGKDEDSDSDA